MATKRVHSKAQKPGRTSPGAGIARPLVKWLNRAMAKMQDNRQARESLIRVLEFAKAISKYTRQRSALERALTAGAATKGMVLRVADSDFDLHNELTAILARYTFVATADGPNALRFRGRFDAGSFACNFLELSKKERKRISRGRASNAESSEEVDDVWSRLRGVSPGERWFLPEPASRPLPEELAIKGSAVEPEASVDYEDLSSVIYADGFNETDAVLVVFQLAQQDYISNLRIGKCLHFFYSSKRNQNFCSKRCRFHYWNATPKARKARRVAAKTRRDKEKKYRKYWTKKKSQGRRQPKRRAHR